MQKPLEVIKENKASHVVAAFVSLLDEAVEASKEKLTKCDIEETAKLQGEIRGLRNIIKAITKDSPSFKTFNNGY